MNSLDSEKIAEANPAAKQLPTNTNVGMRILWGCAFFSILALGCLWAWSFHKESDKTTLWALRDTPYPVEEQIIPLNHLYGKTSKKVYRAESVIEGADPATFTIIDDSYSKDSNNVYYGTKSITAADPESFVLLEEDYAKDAHHVYYFKDIVEGADPETFSIVDTSYSKDAHAVYTYDDESSTVKKLALDIDPLTFTVVQDDVIKDSTHVYFRDYLGSAYRQVIGVDAATFEYAGICIWVEKSQGRYFKDKDFVYVENYGSEGNRVIPTSINARSFEYLGAASINEMVGVAYVKDAQHVYYSCGDLLDEADPATFTYFSNGFSKDKDTVWLQGEILPNADSETFAEMQGSQYGKDKNTVWFFNTPVEGADPQTFEVYSASPYYAKDVNSVYLNGKVLPESDPETFVLFDRGYYTKDKNHVYTAEGKVIFDADPSTFQTGYEYGEAQDKNFIYRYGEVVGKVGE